MTICQVSGEIQSSQVLAEEVFDQRDFGGVALHADPGDGRKAGKLGGLEAALAGDEVKRAGDRFEICPPIWISTRKRSGWMMPTRVIDAVSSSSAWGSMDFRG